MRISPENIAINGYSLVEKVNHKEYKTFIQSVKWTYSTMHILYSCLVLSFLVLAIYSTVQSSGVYLLKISIALLGVVLSFLLIPLHEFIHYLMFKVFGANNVTIKRISGTTFVLTMADLFLIGKEEVKWIAIMPCAFLSVILIVLFLVSSSMVQILLATTLLTHTTFCQDDFRLIHYFMSSPTDLKMYTDMKLNTTYIYKNQIEI